MTAEELAEEISFDKQQVYIISIQFNIPHTINSALIELSDNRF